MSESLIVGGFLGLMGVIVVYCSVNFHDVKKEHRELKQELKARLFVPGPNGQLVDIKTILGAHLVYNKVKIEATSGIKIIKDEYLNRKK